MMHNLENSIYLKYFKTHNSLKIPRPMRIVSVLIICAILLSCAFLVFTPWVQTSSGTGRVTALNPEDRAQQIHALVSGRIGKWHVRDGDRVKKGDPIVEIVDNDPNLVIRLQDERDAVVAKLRAAEKGAKTAEIDYRRQDDLYKQGLSAKKDREQALIKLEDLKSKAAAVRAELKKVEVRLSRQTTQSVNAPRDGTILNINAGDQATFVKTGDTLASFLPSDIAPAVEMYVQGLDAPLVYPGREVRLVFEGWPAVQFSGWPSLAVGTFKGIVQAVDPALSANGRIRVLVAQPRGERWPSSHFLRFGTRARGWILLETVPMGYEVWRQLNNFPPEFSEKARENVKKKWGIY